MDDEVEESEAFDFVNPNCPKAWVVAGTVLLIVAIVLACVSAAVPQRLEVEPTVTGSLMSGLQSSFKSGYLEICFAQGKSSVRFCSISTI
ncbi:unnamed protein product [Echinostoma caproni]|uniref:Transmembrane protein n=1 Tax=Echinostoma caproni TaxID=27848 RepID=A0A183ALK6_9TREM|nr:unnamed protein product [Echinostoma caproni]